MAKQFSSASSGVLGGVEGLAHNHPWIAAAVGAFMLAKTEDHGMIRSIADFWTLKDLFQGKAGMLEKAYLAYDAGEGAADLAGKAGATGLTKFFAGVAGFVAGLWGENKFENDVNAPASRQPAPAMG